MAGAPLKLRKSDHRLVSTLFHSDDNPHISDMPKRKSETESEVIRLKATPAALIGFVQAPDKRYGEQYPIASLLTPDQDDAAD